MSKQFEIGKLYRLVDASKCDGGLARALAMGLVAFPEDGVFTCHSRGAGNVDHLECGVAFSHTKGIVNHSWREEGDIPAAYDEDLEAGIFEEVLT